MNLAQRCFGITDRRRRRRREIFELGDSVLGIDGQRMYPNITSIQHNDYHDSMTWSS